MQDNKSNFESDKDEIEKLNYEMEIQKELPLEKTKSTKKQDKKNKESIKKNKGKNPHIFRKIVAVMMLIVIVQANFMAFAWFNDEANKIKTPKEVEQYLHYEKMESLLAGTKILYLEAIEREDNYNDIVVMPNENIGNIEESTYINSLGGYKGTTTYGQLNHSFDSDRNAIDYCVLRLDEKGDYQISEKNTTNEIEALLDTSNTDSKYKTIKEYDTYIILEYDEKGNFIVEQVVSNYQNPDEIMKILQQVEREMNISVMVYDKDKSIDGIRDTKIIYGINDEDYNIYSDNTMEEWDSFWIYSDVGADLFYFITLGVITIFSFIIGWKIVLGKNIDNKSKSWLIIRYPLEMAIIGVIFIINLMPSYLYIISWVNKVNNSDHVEYLSFTGENARNFFLLEKAAILFAIFAVWYLCISVFRSIICKGPLGLIKDKSLLYQIIPLIKKIWNKTIVEINSIAIDVSAKKAITKIVLINFIVVLLISCTWIIGIPLLVIYSLFVLYLIKKYYYKKQEDYKRLLNATKEIVAGNMDKELQENVGAFESLKIEINKIQKGLQVAVNQEIKSQRLKTDLITNVSHDLKTPLTAITTYIELLKNEEITLEEKRIYIETLEKKTSRLKVLIEDLFEISKASSDNITLELAEVDIVNLIRQVSVEVNDKLEQSNLSVKWKVPEEKITLLLDSQKTYRIFENLFINIAKYAMPHTRVYIDIIKNNKNVTVILRNVSELEIDFTPEEISERFVRGDLARNTEGSGLGLAIAKSFVEAQKGTFSISAEGDLFKVTIKW